MKLAFIDIICVYYTEDYHCILGEYIPYRKCGFKTLEDLVRSLPNVRLSVVGSEIFIDAKPDEKTAHIVDLVRNQKPAKKKSVSLIVMKLCTYLLNIK